MSDFESDIELRTDHYFKLTKSVVNKHGDVDVTYAIFMRRPVIYCSKLAIEWINLVINYRGGSIDIKECFEEGAWVGAGEVLMYLSGRLTHLADLETIFGSLPKICIPIGLSKSLNFSIFKVLVFSLMIPSALTNSV